MLELCGKVRSHQGGAGELCSRLIEPAGCGSDQSRVRRPDEAHVSSASRRPYPGRGGV